MRKFLLILISLTLIINIVYAGERGELTVAFINVGHGDAILIKTPSGHAVLIDGGDDGQETAIIKWLNKLGINQRIDNVILTHPEANHIGGLTKIIKKYDVGDIYDPGMPFATIDYESFLELIMTKQDAGSSDADLTDILNKKHHYEYFNPRAGDVLNWGPDVEVVVLSPLKLFHNTRSDPHNNSIVIKLTYNKISFLLTGNIEIEAEKGLAAQGAKINTTFLKVPNHGSPYSSNLFFLNKVKPQYAIITAGKKNKFGYPAKKVLDNLQEINSKILRTDLNGSIVIRTDGIDFNIEPEKVTDETLITAKTYKSKVKEEKSDNDLVKEAKVNINTESADALVQKIPGLGAFKAQMIVRHREKHGAFESIDDLVKVPGINQAILNKIKDQITTK